MSSPTAVPLFKFEDFKFEELSLSKMAPTTRSQAHQQATRTSSEYNDTDSESESGSGSSSMSDDDDDDRREEDEPIVVTSPSKLCYNLDRLSPEARERVRDTFDHPPQLSLKKCLLRDNYYAFHMTELVDRSIRIGSPDSRWPKPYCSCMEENAPPCEHLLWFLDQLSKQTLYDHDLTLPLNMASGGYPEEIGDPYKDISTFHLDVLADGLHCNIFDPTTVAGDESEHVNGSSDSEDSGESDSEDYLDRPIPRRIQEIREMLAVVTSASAPEDFRPDLVSSSIKKAAVIINKNPIKRHDLEGTIFRMLLTNDEFFHYFLSKMRPTDPVSDPFRKLSQRVDRVLHELDAFAAGTTSTTLTEGPRDVAWAARHITGVVGLIRAAIFKRQRPLEGWERSSAARALIHILSGVVERNRDFIPPSTGRATAASLSRQDRNIYLRLVGDRDEGFVVSILNLLPPDAAAPFLHSLDVIQDRLGVNGAPTSYVEKLRSLMARLKRRASVASQSSAAGSKRQSQGPDRDSKRVK
ncbi:SWIM zinc finger protein [Colletotrichum truncatum]|uniref:SWIM zinc finger protein n=1 Tax=Colletotrichum truncatum TaxID=5467 RepID=A0ACC3Z5D9_COLTU|nr:SWIM zinc finger protein [Colletotrichum truncatum]KAF6795192.1 SWIM zinc finger protein [Colletotrichum truncatum]